MGALDSAVRAGKARYAGISSYGPERTAEATQILGELGTPLLIHQPSYSMLNRWIEEGLLSVLEREGVGCIVFSPLAQLAIAWALRDARVTSALLGASSVAQLEQNVAALKRSEFDPAELEEIDRYAGDGGVNIWAASSSE